MENGPDQWAIVKLSFDSLDGIHTVRRCTQRCKCTCRSLGPLRLSALHTAIIALRREWALGGCAFGCLRTANAQPVDDVH